jgi:hypothetical protein
MIYRKRGSVVRWENGTLVHVVESGVAIEEGELFECHPDADGETPRVDDAEVIEAARAVQSIAAKHDVAIERLIVIDGVAEHAWSAAATAAAFVSEQTKAVAAATALHERTQRIHLSLIRARTRAILDLGSFAMDDVERVAASLARSGDVAREAPPRLRLAPNVTAALLPALVGMAPPNVRLVQTAGGIDGRGAPIVEADGAWPNWYRPSYRVRPVRMPLQLRLECDVQAIDRERPIAVALLAPVSLTANGLIVRALIDDGRRAFPAAVRIARIDAVSAATTWYPYGGGSFGAEMIARAIVNRLEDRGLVEFLDAKRASSHKAIGKLERARERATESQSKRDGSRCSSSNRYVDDPLITHGYVRRAR